MASAKQDFIFKLPFAKPRNLGANFLVIVNFIVSNYSQSIYYIFLNFALKNSSVNILDTWQNTAIFTIHYV